MRVMIPTTCEWRPHPTEPFCPNKVEVQVETPLLGIEEQTPSGNHATSVLYCCRGHGRIAYQHFLLVADIDGNYWENKDVIK